MQRTLSAVEWLGSAAALAYKGTVRGFCFHARTWMVRQILRGSANLSKTRIVKNASIDPNAPGRTVCTHGKIHPSGTDRFG